MAVAGRCPKCHQFLRLPQFDELERLESTLREAESVQDVLIRCRKCGEEFPVSELTAGFVPSEQSQFSTATRFFDNVVRSFQEIVEEGADGRLSGVDVQDFAVLIGRMVDAKTKRILVDHRQGQVFLDMEEAVPDHIRTELHWPFDHLYMEFDGPVRLDADDPTHLLRAVLVRYSDVPYEGFDHNLSAFHTQGAEVLADSFAFSWTKGIVYNPHHDIRLDPNRMAVLLSYLASYMMAKGIVIVSEPISRQQKRLLARKGLPNPWHVIRVNPTVRDTLPPSGEDDGYQRRHGYRYDVMGHLRFGRHKLKDGSYRSTVEWVKPHQRGLRHERYIPAIRRFKGDRPMVDITEAG